MRCKSLLFILAFLPLLCAAQNDDLELWASLKFSKDVSKRVRFELEEQVRWADSLSQYKKNFTNIGVKYELHKRHSLSGFLRIIDELDEEKYMRFHIDLNSSLNLKGIPIAFKQRLRYQYGWDGFSNYDKSFVRAKWSCVVKSNFISPFLAHEFYWEIPEYDALSRQRTTLGLQWAMAKDLKVKLYLRNHAEVNKKNPDRLSIIGIGTHYKF